MNNKQVQNTSKIKTIFQNFLLIRKTNTLKFYGYLIGLIIVIILPIIGLLFFSDILKFSDDSNSIQKISKDDSIKNQSLNNKLIRPVKIYQVGMVKMKVVQLSYPGLVKASKQVDLAFKSVGGRLLNLPYENKEGHYVEAGEKLAELDTTDFVINYNNAVAQLQRGQVAYDFARREYYRERSIYASEPGATSRAILSQRKNQLDSAEANVEALQIAIEDAKNKLGYTTLYAPFSGIISKVHVNNHQVVQHTQTIISLQNINYLDILADFPESFMKKFQILKNYEFAQVDFPNLSGNKKYSLKVKEYSIESNESTQTFQIVFQMKQPKDVRILPGMSARVWIDESNFNQNNSKLSIPSIAVLGDNENRHYIWKVNTNDMTVTKQLIDVKELTGNEYIEVEDGLSNGDQIVITGLTKLREGMKIREWRP